MALKLKKKDLILVTWSYHSAGSDDPAKAKTKVRRAPGFYLGSKDSEGNGAIVLSRSPAVKGSEISEEGQSGGIVIPTGAVIKIERLARGRQPAPISQLRSGDLVLVGWVDPAESVDGNPCDATPAFWMTPGFWHEPKVCGTIGTVVIEVSSSSSGGEEENGWLAIPTVVVQWVRRLSVK